MVRMGCMESSQRVGVFSVTAPQGSKTETVVAALTRIDEEIVSGERAMPAARLAVVNDELDSIQQEISKFEETTPTSTKDSYSHTMHQMFVSLDLYRRPVLATENEDFVANVNRKEMHRLELSWLRRRQSELLAERKALHSQILQLRSLYAQLQQLLESIWSSSPRPGTPLEGTLKKAISLRDALAAVSVKLRAAAEYAHNAVRMVDDALPAWKLTAIGKSGWERTNSCADACKLFVDARCLERGARRVLSAHAAPRAARTLRLALDYAFTDAMHDHKYQKATEAFLHFKEALVQLIESIHQKLFRDELGIAKCLVTLVAKWFQKNIFDLKMFKNFTKLLKCSNVQTTLSRSQQKKVENIQVFINGRSVTVPPYFTILQALRKERVTIPSFCYHERLSVAGNCRMCLVQIEGLPKLQIACAVNVGKGMKIRTNSELTTKAQESVLEFLLINHPLDCPICDQGGECDLQDLSMRFGNDRSRFTDIHFSGKRAVEDKNLGPLVRTEMTRCIHCTRCIRFGAQVCGLDVLGTAGRGTDMLVGTYVDKMFLSELSGNIIDLCPVGALTAIPYMFKARPWEVRKANSIDVTDATGTNIVVNYRFDRVLRVLPREHDEINQEWVSDKGRWAIDSLEMQRLVTPMQRVNTCLCPLDWDCALQICAALISSACPETIMAVAGPHCNVETLVAAKDLVNILGSEHTYVERGMKYTASSTDLRAAYCMNVNMKDVVRADRILLVGTNPRFEAPILNAWIRQAYRTNECDIYAIGPWCDYNYHVNYLGDDCSALARAASAIKGAKQPLIFVGASVLESDSASKIMGTLTKLADSLKIKDWGIMNIVTREASFAGALEAGWKPGALSAIKKGSPSLLICLGADEVFYDYTPASNVPVIYIGFQGDKGAGLATMVLPGSAYTESGGLYLNMEGRSQYAFPAVTPPGMARQDWKIIRALAEYCGICMFYHDHDTLSCRMGQISPNFNNLGKYQQKLFSGLVSKLVNNDPGTGPIDVEMRTLKDYYCSDVFTYNSTTMIKAQKAAVEFSSSSYCKI